ncbi:thiamine diphosphokinase [Shimia abyssi]|uniref:thiamine diphosphokinase n=1 Tax=Shimia abyssi TaxID=1662395 RepID=UPI001FAF9056|nr:thiamine diphosphokinase [Shimia abyssi]
MEPITLVGAGECAEIDIKQCLDMAPRVFAADGGARHCRAAGIMPELVIGDLDSILEGETLDIPPTHLHHVAEQDSTDFEKALRVLTAPLILGVGFTGARMDHQLACYNALVRYPERRCVLLSDSDIAFLAPPSLELPLVAGTRVSLFPMGLVEGVSDGLRWPIAGLTFTPDGRIGTSNEATGAVMLSVTAPKMLVILPRECFAIVVTALAAPSGSWPAL